MKIPFFLKSSTSFGSITAPGLAPADCLPIFMSSNGPLCKVSDNTPKCEGGDGTRDGSDAGAQDGACQGAMPPMDSNVG